MKATMVSRSGKCLSRGLLTSAVLASTLLCRRNLGRRFCRGNRSARLAHRFRFRLGGSLFRGSRLGGLCGLQRLVLFGLGWLRLLRHTLRLAAALGGTLIDQRDGLGQGDGLLRLVAGNGGIDAARGDIGAIAAALGHHGTESGMLAERLAWIGAKTPARPLCDFFRDQRHRAVEADVEHLVTGFKTRIGFFMPYERTE